jgi:hypothetical protein
MKRNLLIHLLLSAVVAVSLQGCCKVQQRPQGLYEPELTKYKTVGKASQSSALLGTVGSLDVHYQPDEKPQMSYTKTWTVTAWKAERVNGKFLVWSDAETKHTRLSVTDMVGKDGRRISSENIRPYFQRYVLADNTPIADITNTCNMKMNPWRRADIKPIADIIDTAAYIDIPQRTIRQIWLMVDVPPDAAAGSYQGKLLVRANEGKEISFDLKLTVLDKVLPPPSQWKFWLDLWISPWAVARYHHVPLWSDEHLQIMKPYLEKAADIGQKCIHLCIMDFTWGDQLWGEEPLDTLSSLIKWTKNADNTWTFDYTIFDRYVSFAAECGLTGQLNCDSMVTWGNNYYYHDGATGDYIVRQLTPGSDEYNALWIPFLEDFTRHLKEKGWLDRAVIYFNERLPHETMKAVELVQKYAPGLNCALAGNNHSEYYDTMRDYSLITPEVNGVPDDVRARRLERGWTTTFYVCCWPARPNNFTFGPPIENVWMGWYAAAEGLDGFLRWNFNMWIRDPFATTDYGSWGSGDTLLVYPGPRSSIRFERLREGIQDFEKIRILRQQWKTEGPDSQKKLAELDKLLENFRYPDCGTPQQIAVNIYKARALLN